MAGRTNRITSGSELLTDKEENSELYLQHIREKNLSSLDRSIAAASDGLSIGAETLLTLGKQKEQLQRTEDKLDEVNEDMSKSEWILKGMKSIFGAISNVFSGFVF